MIMKTTEIQEVTAIVNKTDLNLSAIAHILATTKKATLVT